MAKKSKTKQVVALAVQENIQRTEISAVMMDSYRDYSAAVVVGRAIPDVRDGLKPVHRRILYAMKVGGYDWNNPLRKSARIVGDVIGKFHPHGDTAVYEAMARLTQNWSVNAPLVDGQGNFGSSDGDSPAAMRYTEARLNPIAKHLLGEINRGTVGFRPNYDGEEVEPVVLPSAFPNLLVNGGSGIAVGMASSIPPHNLREVISATLARIADPEISTADIMEIIPGPDLPTYGRIIGGDGIRKAYETGRGTALLEATANFEMDGSTPVIIYTDMPYGVTASSVLGRINQLMRDGKLPEVLAARDESNREGTRFVVELRKGVDQQNTDLRLKSQTDLRTTISLNFTALDAQSVPKEMGILEILDHWISFRRSTVRKRLTFDLRKTREQGRLLVGRIAAISAIDRIVKKIRESGSKAEAIAAICAMSFASEDFGELVQLLGTKDQRATKRFSLTETQAEDILDMKLQRLTRLEHGDLEQKGLECAEEIKELQGILNDPRKLDEVINDELTAIMNEHGRDRRTIIDIGATVEKPAAARIVEPREECFIEVNSLGLIQRRKKRPTLDENSATTIYAAHSHARLIAFTDLGFAYGVDVAALPRHEERKEDPRSFIGLVGSQLEGAIVTIMVLDEEDFKSPDQGGSLLVFTTEDGYMRRTEASEFASIQSTGKMAMKLSGNDAPIQSVVLTKSEQLETGVFVGTANGKTLRFDVSEIRVFNGRTSRGVRAMKIDPSDRVVSVFALPLTNATAAEMEVSEKQWIASKAEQGPEIIQVATTGQAKRSPLFSYPQMKRDGKGLNDKSPAKTIGEICSYVLHSGTYEHVLIQTGKEDFARVDIKEIRKGGRAATGAKHVAQCIGLKIPNYDVTA